MSRSNRRSEDCRQGPLPRWSCDARLDYLTKMFFRMTRQNPDLKDKTAVRSACVPVSSIQ